MFLSEFIRPKAGSVQGKGVYEQYSTDFNAGIAQLRE